MVTQKYEVGQRWKDDGGDVRLITHVSYDAKIIKYKHETRGVDNWGEIRSLELGTLIEPKPEVKVVEVTTGPILEAFFTNQSFLLTERDKFKSLYESSQQTVASLLSDLTRAQKRLKAIEVIASVV